MSYSFENYWKNIYQKRINSNYKKQSIQSQAIINWHKKYIRNQISQQFKDYKPRVLDIGCCSGYLTNLFCNFSSEVVGIDYQEGFIKEARIKYSSPKFLTGDIYELKKIDGIFDLVVCFGVLQNITDLQSVLKNVKLKLNEKVNSKIIFTTINKNSIFNKYHIGKKITHPDEMEKFNLNLFDKEKFEKFSKISGLKLIQFKYLYVLPGFLEPLNFIAKYLLPSSFSHHILIELKHA